MTTKSEIRKVYGKMGRDQFKFFVQAAKLHVVIRNVNLDDNDKFKDQNHLAEMVIVQGRVMIRYIM